MTEFVKSLFDSLDKVTDILNVGRLIFYTTAGYLVLLPVGMSFHLLGHGVPTASYWGQFYSDLIACSKRPELWIAAVILGFVIATLANAVVMSRFRPAPPREIKPDFYSYQYARMFSGGVKSKDTTDYASWLIREYYRYVEIAVFIPYSVILSLPVYALYTLIYLIRKVSAAQGLNLGAAHYAFAVWTFAAAFAWVVWWPKFWMPRVAEPAYHDWVHARRAAIKGLVDFVAETPKSTQ